MELGDLQRGSVPSFDTGAFAWAQGALEAKRRRAAGHLVPRLRTCLGAQAWVTLFHDHIQHYTPAGMLHHVDDAWAFAEWIERTNVDPVVCRATQDDLVTLRLRYVRDPRETAFRIRERRGLLLAMLHTPQRAMVVKLPGSPGKLWYVRV